MSWATASLTSSLLTSDLGTVSAERTATGIPAGAEHLGGKTAGLYAFRNEVAKALRGKSKFQLVLLQSLLEETERHIEQDTARLYELEAKLQNAEQLRREIEVKQLKYIGLDQIFTTGTMEEKKMLLSILISRVELKRGYELNICLSPGFEQFLEGLIEMR